MHQVRVIYLFPINYMSVKYKFSENMNWPQFAAKTTF